MTDIPPNSFLPRSIQIIDDAIARCSDKREVLVLLAKRACNLASHAYLQEAASNTAELRIANDAYDPRLTGWINFAEGVIEHFSTLDSKRALYKLSRALLFSQMASDRELAASCSAWVAHCNFVDGRIDAVAENIVNAFKWSDASEHEARGRASMLLADAFGSIGNSQKSRYWFRLARNHASESGNIAMQNVMLFNIAAYSVSRLTLDDCVSRADPDEVRHAGMEVASASNLNAALGIQALPTLVPTMQAELSIVEKKWSEAAIIFDNHPSAILSNGPRRLIPKFIAQRAWCHANMDEHVAAEAMLNRALELSAECTDDDDRAVLHFRLSGIARLIGLKESESENMEVALEYLSRFRNHQTKIREMIDSVINRIAMN